MLIFKKEAFLQYQEVLSLLGEVKFSQTTSQSDPFYGVVQEQKLT